MMAPPIGRHFLSFCEPQLPCKYRPKTLCSLGYCVTYLYRRNQNNQVVSIWFYAWLEVCLRVLNV